jgi:hypothetical protein
MSYLDDLSADVYLALAKYDQEVQAAVSDNLLKDSRIAELEAQVAALQPAPPQMRVGISVRDKAQFEQRTADFGVKPELARVFYPTLPTMTDPGYQCQRIVSFKPPNNDVQGFIDGKYDVGVSNWLISAGAVRVAVYHEREDNIEAGQFTKAQAVAMDAHMAELVSKYGRARFGIILMSWTLDPRSKRTLSDYVGPGNPYEWIGWDSYPGDYVGNDLPDLAATHLEYGRCADNSFGLPWYICETGTRNYGGTPEAYDDLQAAWITGAVAIAQELGCRGWCYFDSTVGGDFTLKGPKAYAAMAAAIRA